MGRKTYQSSPTGGGGVGYREDHIHPASGLRIATATASISTAREGVNVAMTEPVVSLLAVANTNTYVSIRDSAIGWFGSMPYPMTPTVRMSLLAVDTTPRFQLRFTGYDQFGQRIIEETPIISIAGYDLAGSEHLYYITASKVFSYLDDVEFRADKTTFQTTPGFETGFRVGWYAIADGGSLDNTAAFLDDDVGIATVHNTLGTFANWGLGTPLRVSPYGYDPGASIAASSTLTFTGAPADNDTVTIDGVVYTWKTAITAGVANQILRGASAAEAAANLGACLNHSGTPGTQYTAITPSHPTCWASSVTATTTVVKARIPGSQGNSIAISENSAAHSFSPVNFLGGGSDSSLSRFPELLGFGATLLRQRRTPTVINTAATFYPYGLAGVATGIAMGRSAPSASSATGNGITYSYGSWQGTPHKVGFRSNDAFATSALPLNGSSTEIGDIPTSEAMVGEDEFLFSFTVRSNIGTQRDTVSGGV